MYSGLDIFAQQLATYFGRMIMALYLFQVKLKIVVLMENKSPVFLSTERVFGFFPSFFGSFDLNICSGALPVVSLPVC